MFMRNKFLLLLVVSILAIHGGICFAQQGEWEKGGPKYLYLKPKKLPARHGVYDEEMKCIDCHQYDGVDAYTSATMTLKKTRKGRMPREEIEKAIIEALKGKGDYREIFVLGTSFNNKPMATVIEFVLDPKTFTFYAASEKQTEKLFHVASNQNVSMAYLKQREDHQYFRDPLGVQVIGKAKLLKGSDPEFMEALEIYLPTLPTPQSKEMKEMVKMKQQMAELVKQTKIITKVTPERMVILSSKFKKGGFHQVQVWEAEKK
jgi:nitroimidazol reductase NimA-like FMN-containing flavoprotein (pyridoxamine 5'-phosphate oxidase superfamily)